MIGPGLQNSRRRNFFNQSKRNHSQSRFSYVFACNRYVTRENQCDSRTWRHMWIEFVIGSCPCSEKFLYGYSDFLLSKTKQNKTKQKTSIFKFPAIRSRKCPHIVKRICLLISSWKCALYEISFYFLNNVIKGRNLQT